jgi:hypothetical protein
MLRLGPPPHPPFGHLLPQGEKEDESRRSYLPSPLAGEGGSAVRPRRMRGEPRTLFSPKFAHRGSCRMPPYLTEPSITGSFSRKRESLFDRKGGVSDETEIPAFAGMTSGYFGRFAAVASPHPSSPARGEVELGHGLATNGTLPLAGRVGEGVATHVVPAGCHQEQHARSVESVYG